MINGYAAMSQGADLVPFSYDPGPLGRDDVEIDIDFCGICHSDLSVLNNEWGNAVYPFVPGHEIVGRIAAVGENVTQRQVGQPVGVGWFSSSCMVCGQCMSGNHNLCPDRQDIIIGRNGGFADKVRAHANWTIPLPEAIDNSTAGPLFCGGITVFNPIVQFGVRPTDRVGVIGIGGLGHLAVQFLAAWGCEVTAFTSDPDKGQTIRELGAHHVLSSVDKTGFAGSRGRFDFILNTANADLDWSAYIDMLAPKGRLHFVGAVPGPISTGVFPLLMGQKSLSASPLGSPSVMAEIVEFAVRHNIAPVGEHVPLGRVNDALEHLRRGKARYRVILTMNQEA